MNICLKRILIGSYFTALAAFTLYLPLKVFVIPTRETSGSVNGGIYLRDQSEQAGNTSETVNYDDLSGESAESEAMTNDEAIISDRSYEDENIKITITETRVSNTSVYIADVEIKSVLYLKAALAENTYGRNLKETTSSMASSHDAILAINGDYYGFRSTGYVLRNGVLYRSINGDSADESFVVYEDGSCDVVTESAVSAETLLNNGAVQILSFGPGLVEDGQISVTPGTEVDQSMQTNPRTAIGMISPLHYLFVVSDGRTSVSTGLSLNQLAQVMKDYGCTEAYNLDGGGSSSMYFNGNVINQPTTNGKTISERQVSDIVYIGY